MRARSIQPTGRHSVKRPLALRSRCTAKPTGITARAQDNGHAAIRGGHHGSPQRHGCSRGDQRSPCTRSCVHAALALERCQRYLQRSATLLDRHADGIVQAMQGLARNQAELRRFRRSNYSRSIRAWKAWSNGLCDSAEISGRTQAQKGVLGFDRDKRAGPATPSRASLAWHALGARASRSLNPSTLNVVSRPAPPQRPPRPD